jgi:multidrug efflux pump subunit AcrA (membrane-fusion protein)
MRPGMSVRVEVIRRAWERALTVPRRAVLRRDKGTFVARAGGGEPVAVGIAACTPTDCVIESGLSEGDHVRLY